MHPIRLERVTYGSEDYIVTIHKMLFISLLHGFEVKEKSAADSPTGGTLTPASSALATVDLGGRISKHVSKTPTYI